jgi:hypothetical protein
MSLSREFTAEIKNINLVEFEINLISIDIQLYEGDETLDKKEKMKPCTCGEEKMKGCRLRVAHNDCKIKASGGLSGLVPAASFCKVKRGSTRIVILHK